MKIAHTLVVGETGSGKSTLVLALLRLTARSVVLDQEAEYDDIPGAIYADTFDAAAAAFLAHRWRPFCIVMQSESSDDYLKMVELVLHTQTVEPHGPVVIVGEEFSEFSDTHSIDDDFALIYRRGRKRAVAMLTVVQSDTDVHRVTRKNSRLIVAMASSELTTNMKQKFRLEEIQSLRSLSLEGEYTDTPVQGRHFSVYPRNVNLYDEWTKLYGYIVKLRA